VCLIIHSLPFLFFPTTTNGSNWHSSGLHHITVLSSRCKIVKRLNLYKPMAMRQKQKAEKKRSCTIPSSPQATRCLTNKVMTTHPALFPPILAHPACGFVGPLAVSRHLNSQDLILLKTKRAPFHDSMLALQVSHTSTQVCPCFSMCKLPPQMFLFCSNILTSGFAQRVTSEDTLLQIVSLSSVKLLIQNYAGPI
jgi:hypothetical protein